MGRLDGKVALITGSASGMGRATAQLFSREGALVVVADINHKAIDELVIELGTANIGLKLDVSNVGEWEEAVSSIEEKYGRLDILVNCAGTGTLGDFEDLSLDDWNAMLSVNLTGTFLACKYALKLMKKNTAPASIINISSIAGLTGWEDATGYCASKGGVTMFTKALALYCAGKGYGIRCNSIHPTYVDTPMLTPFLNIFSDHEQMSNFLGAKVPLGRIAQPEDIARTILFLASDDAAMVTGHQMVVDGGQLAGFKGHLDGFVPPE